jgi:PAS domain S-box-containing protein
LRVLFVEDTEDDVLLLLRELRRGGWQVSWRRVERADTMREALSEPWDFVLSDFSMPEFSAKEAVDLLTSLRPELPIIIVSGTIGEETAVAALKGGANDFISKNQLARLLPAIDRELREARVRTERRLAEATLRESERTHRRIVDAAQEGIWVLDADGRTTFANRRMAELFGRPVDELLGTRHTDLLVNPADAPLYLSGDANTSVIAFRRHDDSEFWASVSTSLITDSHGTANGVLAMVTDITDLRKLQEQLMVSDRMASVGILAAGVAHEINNPLTAVLANLHAALADAADLNDENGPSETLDALTAGLRDAREAATRVRDIVRDLRIFSRTSDEDRRRVDVVAVLESSLRMAWTEIRHRARLVRDFQIETPPDANGRRDHAVEGSGLLVHASESRLGQVFLNLVINAAQAIEEGQAEANEIRVVARRDGASIVIEVNDTGIGMTPEIRRRLFTPFFTTKPRGVGTGLGLSICHRIVTSFGGTIAVTSEPGRGSTFRVTLPAVEELPAPFSPVDQVAPRDLRVPPTRRGRIAVVDDEALVVATLQRGLGHDHDVVAFSPRDLVAAIEAGQRFDLILCDVMMPDMTGMDVHAALTRSAPDHAAAMVFLTGGGFTPRAREFLATTTNTTIDKPFDLPSLRDLVNRRIQ